MDRLGQSIKSAEELLNHLLDVARLESGAITPNFSDVDLAQVLSDLKADLDPVATAKELAFRTHGASIVVRTDPAILKRILFNIAANAISYTDQGGVLIGIRRKAGQAIIEVWDTGIGIAEEQAKYVFEEFYQIGNPARDRTKGVGLGLAIVRRLCLILGCEVNFVSRLGKGTVFRVSIPLHRNGTADQFLG